MRFGNLRMLVTQRSFAGYGGGICHTEATPGSCHPALAAEMSGPLAVACGALALPVFSKCLMRVQNLLPATARG